MARLKDIARGDRAYCTKTLPLLDNQKLAIAIGVLPFGEEGDAFAEARKYAIAKGVTDPKKGEPIYERALALFIVYASCFDPDQLPDKRVRTFESTQEIEEILDHDRVAMLFQWQRAWQREISPSPKGMTPQDYIKMVVSAAEAEEEEEIPFFSLQHRAQKTFLRFTCALCLSLLQHRSPSGLRLPEEEETLIATLTLASVERTKEMLRRSLVPLPESNDAMSPSTEVPGDEAPQKSTS
jgi:hypothetical protein